jgi:hypothetical protein
VYGPDRTDVRLKWLKFVNTAFKIQLPQEREIYFIVKSLSGP